MLACMTVNTLKSMSKFTYDQLMQWDKNDLAETLLNKQSDIEHLLKCIEKLMNDRKDDGERVSMY
jgi:hypothetical protein